jgi:tRNA A37 threonylcarbamoyladenosine dehydratase
MSDSDKTRRERLAAALRENLRKRKAQARDKAEVPANPPSKD